jgi:hypothetical protein
MIFALRCGSAVSLSQPNESTEMKIERIRFSVPFFHSHPSPDRMEKPGFL